MSAWMDVGTVLAVLGVAGILAGVVTEIYRTRTPRSWWYDLDKRVALLEQRMDAGGGPEAKL